MLIMGSGTGNASSSQQSQEWGQDGQDWEASEDAVYNNTHHVDPPQQKYASFGTSFGKSTWGSKLTQEEEDWTGIGALGSLRNPFLTLRSYRDWAAPSAT